MADPTRRDVLALALGATVAAALAGCTLSDPTVRTPPTATVRPPGGSSASPGASPTPPIAGADRAAQLESRLAGLARQVGDLRSTSKRQRAWLADLTAAHQVHAERLGMSAPIPARKQASFRDLVVAERDAASRFRRTALATRGTDALLWASLATAAAGFAEAAADPHRDWTIARARAPKPGPALTDVAATQELVRQLHAVVFGYQLAIGKLPRGKEHNRGLRQLHDHRVIRDRLIAWLVRREAEVPVAEASYVSSVDPRTPARAARLIRTMLVALQPFCGLVITAADDQARPAAISALTDTVVRARTWGAPLPVWPGYA